MNIRYELSHSIVATNFDDNKSTKQELLQSAIHSTSEQYKHTAIYK